MEQTEWEVLTPEQKKEKLFLRQKELLDTFLKTGAITEAQYNRSLGDLIRKMGIGDGSSARNTKQTGDNDDRNGF